MKILGYEITVKKIKSLENLILDEADRNGWPHQKLYLVKAFRNLDFHKTGLYESKALIEDLFVYESPQSTLMRPK